MIQNRRLRGNQRVSRSEEKKEWRKEEKKLPCVGINVRKVTL